MDGAPQAREATEEGYLVDEDKAGGGGDAGCFHGLKQDSGL